MRESPSLSASSCHHLPFTRSGLAWADDQLFACVAILVLGILVAYFLAVELAKAPFFRLFER